VSRVGQLLLSASYGAFYDLIAIALECGDTRTARSRVMEAAEYLPLIELHALVRELEADYYEFAYE
jgi:hypothetical protein